MSSSSSSASSSSSSSGLSAEDIQTLKAIYEQNKRHDPGNKQDTKQRAPPFHDAAEVTDESLAIIRNAHFGRRRRYHGYSDGAAACGVQIKSYVTSREKAAVRQWSLPCKRCYPPGTDERERELEACALDLDLDPEVGSDA